MVKKFIESLIKTIAKKELAKNMHYVLNENLPSFSDRVNSIINIPNNFIPQNNIPYTPPINYPNLRFNSNSNANFVYSIFNPNKPIKVKILKEKKKKKISKKTVTHGIKLPNLGGINLSEQERIKLFLGIDLKSEKDIHLQYPVTKEKIDDKEYTFAYVRIYYREDLHSLLYEVLEPNLEEKYFNIIYNTLKKLENKLDYPLDLFKDREKAKEYLLEKVEEIWDLEGLKIPDNISIYLKYYIIRDTLGYGKIDPLMHDPNIEDISCNGVGVPIFIFHKNPYIGEIKTNIVFNTDEELNSFVMKLALRTGRMLSVSKPLLDGALPDGSRIQITYGRDISRKGSTFTIRKFSKDPFTPIKLLNYGTVDFTLMSYLWTLIENGKSMLISGGTATGKTSFLNAISLFIKPEKKIVSIEDTPELQLPHPNWLPEVSREGFGPNNYGAVTLVDLLKAALRQRPDYIIVGEVRGEEAYILFQAMATGHTGLGTIHAETFESLIDRLISPPINLPPVLLETLDTVIFLKRLRYKGKYVRRVNYITEIIKYDTKKKEIVKNIPFKWSPKTDTFEIYDSYLLEEIKELNSWSDQELEANLRFKAEILKYLWKNKIEYYKDFAKYISLYYYDPQKLARIIGIPMPSL